MVFNRSSEKAEHLKRVPLFAHLGKHQLDQIARDFDEVTMPAGTVLARQGEIGQEFVFVLDGRVRVERDGKALSNLGPGEFFGEIALLDQGPRTATIVAETEVDLMVLHVQYFNALLDHTPQLARDMLKALCGYVRRAEGLERPR